MQCSSSVLKEEKAEEEEQEGRAAGNAPRTDLQAGAAAGSENQQLRQLLVAGPADVFRKLPAVDSLSVDSASTASGSNTPGCPPPPPPPHSQPYLLGNAANPAVFVYPSAPVRTSTFDSHVSTTLPATSQLAPTATFHVVADSSAAMGPPFSAPCHAPAPEPQHFYVAQDPQPASSSLAQDLPATTDFFYRTSVAVPVPEGYQHYPQAVYDPSMGPPGVFATPQAPYDAVSLPYVSGAYPHLQYSDPGAEAAPYLQRREPEVLPSMAQQVKEAEAKPQSPFQQPIPLPEHHETWGGPPAVVSPDFYRKRAPAANPGKGSGLSGNPNGQIQLWSFILDELENPDAQDVLCWTGDGWEFRFKDPERVAKKWGEQKNKPSMNYEKMSRGLRYYYDKDIIRKSSSGGRYHYRFTEKKMSERTPYSPTEYFRHHGITPQKEDAGK